MFPSAHLDTFTRDSLPPHELWPEIDGLDDLGYPERINAARELIEKNLEAGRGDRVAIVGAEGEMTYRELDLLVKQISQFFESEGIKPGNRILLRGPNNLSIVAIWLAVLRVGAVAVTTIHLQRAVELEKIVEIGKVQFACIDHRFFSEWEGVSNFKGSTFIYGGESDFIKKARLNNGNHLACDTAQDDVALLAFTSGSTGVPKATMHFHRDLLAIADTFSKHVVKPTSDDVFSGTPPIAFTFGLGGLVIFPFRVGAKTVLLEATPPPQLPDAIEKFGITALFTAPTAYRAMLGNITKEKVKTLRRCVSAGEHLPQATWEAFYKATGVKLIDGIGATEMLHIFISASDDEIIPGMTGKAVPGYRAKVVNEKMEEVADGEVGRLAVQGVTGCRYLNDDRQKSYVKDGWNLTGDLYMRHPNGYFQYQSRSDDMIISSGYNIAAPEVENAILTHSSVAETAVVGIPDEERGMVVTAYVVAREGFSPGDELAKEIQDHVKATIAPYKYPRKIHFVETLPKTTTGKLQRFRLKS
ncbi:MAG: AMP-binding protein [Candidatus Nanopelagicaceae bacterium]